MIDTAPEIQALLHPASAFARPQDVLNDPDLTTQEKRAILSAWASDACAVESHPCLRSPPGARGSVVTFDEVLDALKSLDDDPPPPGCGKGKRPRYRRDGPGPDSGGGVFI